MITINMHVKFEIEIPKQTWLMLRKPCRLQTDRGTDRRTDKVNPVYPPPNFVGWGYNESICIWVYKPFIAFYITQFMTIYALVRWWGMGIIYVSRALWANGTKRIQIQSIIILPVITRWQKRIMKGCHYIYKYIYIYICICRGLDVVLSMVHMWTSTLRTLRRVMLYINLDSVYWFKYLTSGHISIN